MVVEAQKFHPLPLEDIPSFLIDPNDEDSICYIGSLDDTCRHLEANGLTDYLILAIEKKETKEGNTTKVTRHPQIFQVTQTICYRSIAPIALGDLPYEDKVTTAHFSLPPIPVEIINSVEDFLRGVDAKHSTEGIVLLTFDEDAVDEDGNYLREGWGFLIPDQENTGSHCDYKPDSIFDEKPFNVIVVGSIHSHPHMPAFASGTDHHDQSAFNGLHITFGWQSSVQNNATQYHVELQIDSKNWIMQPEQVFEQQAPRERNPEVDQWIEDKVKKKSYTSQFNQTRSGGHSTRGITDAMNPGTGGTSSGAFTNGTSVRRSLRLEDVKGLPEGAPSYADNTIVARLNSPEETFCPFCRQAMISQDRTKRRCTACHGYLAMPGEGISEVLAAREADNLLVWDLNVSENPPKPIIVWERDSDESIFTTVYEVAASGK